MTHASLREIAEETLLKCEIQFHESEIPLSIDEGRKRTLPAVERLLTFYHTIFTLIPQIKEKSSPLKALEIGTGYGALILSLAELFPNFEWIGVEHPERRYVRNHRYRELFEKSGCQLKICDISKEALPFDDNSFSLITFSEVLEHLPMEKVPFVIKEMHRVLCPGGWMIASSPNLVSLLNRIMFLMGKSIFTPPVPLDYAGGTYGHIHLYTADEFVALCKPFGLEVRQTQYKSRFLKYKRDPRFWTNLVYKICWITDLLFSPFTKKTADTWYVVLQKP
jgi:2-polyprenyl-3-methyl-5-hydroxy-6-metoxy-1,4-benzoquinol methylase